MRVKPAAGSNKIAPVAQVEERLTCNQQNGFSSNPRCSNCGRADYRNVGHDCDSCLLWVQLPPATLISRKENCHALGVQRNAIHEQILSFPVRCGDGCEKCGG